MEETKTLDQTTVWGIELPNNVSMEEIAEALAITPIDGRYSKDLQKLRFISSEFALMRDRVQFQIVYLLWLVCWEVAPNLDADDQQKLKSIYQSFSLADFKAIKEIEKKTQHDVEAVKQFVKNKILALGIPDAEKLTTYIHYGLTSADPDNTVRAKSLNDMKDMCLRKYKDVRDTMREIAHAYAEAPMLGRTHGQPALPTTFGKEIAVFVYRLNKELVTLENLKLQAKLGGAIGNMSAHYVAYPNIKWREFAKEFLATEYGLEYAPCTTQIEPYDTHAEVFHCIVRINNILIGFCADMWRYISDDWVKQKVVASEVGSSAMPQKVNPIKFENAEGNLEMSVMLLPGLANKLTRSRLQRDLTDSTVIRNMAIPIAWTLIACSSLEAGFKKIEPNTQLMHGVLMNNWAVLAEPIQTIMRKHGVADAYNQLKELTRGKQMNRELILQFIDELSVPGLEGQKLLDLKNELTLLYPDKYLGDAIQMAKEC